MYHNACRVFLGLSIVGCAAARTATESLDTPSGRLVVSNMNDHTATVLDAGTGRVLATLPTGTGPHEVTVSHDGRWALVSNYGVRGQPGHTITVIDVARVAVARTIDLGSYTRPHGMAFFPGDSLVAVTSETNQSVVIVEFRSGQVVRTIATKGRVSHMLALAQTSTRLATGNIADGTVTLLDRVRADAIVVRVGRQPEGIGISPDGRTVWAGSNQDSVVIVVDADRGAPIDTVRGFGLPYRIVVTPDGRRVVVSDPVRAQVRVIDAATHRDVFVVQVPADSLVATAEVTGSPSPEGVAISGDSRWAFVTLQGRNRVATIDLSTGTIVRYAPTGNWSDGIGFAPLVTQPTR